MEIRNKKYFIFLLGILFIMIIGFAVISTTLNINGTSTINSNSWDVHFQNIVLDTDNTVTGTQTIVDDTTINYSVSLSKPGDKYSFAFDVVNVGSIDAMIESISNTNLTEEQSNLINYSIIYDDGKELNEKDKLLKEIGIDTVVITVEYIYDVDLDDLPSSTILFDLSCTLNYVQADETAILLSHELRDFMHKVKNGEISSDDIGTTFSLSKDGFSAGSIRLSNISVSSECIDPNFSESSCGIVMEYTSYGMMGNMRGINTGGWASSSMRKIVNTKIYETLPFIIRNSIIETKVVSGHGSKDSSNIVTTDKLFLLSAHEVWENGVSKTINQYDSAWDYTKQLDYYRINDVNLDSYAGAKKGTMPWLLRTARLDTSDNYILVQGTGNWGISWDSFSSVTPAFRIA